MRNLPPEQPICDRRPNGRVRIATRSDAHGPYPTPAEMSFQIGLTVAVALGVAFAASLVAAALGG